MMSLLEKIITGFDFHGIWKYCPSGDWYCSAASPVRDSTYSAPPSKVSRATSPPCFSNWGTAAGAVLNTRQGAFPAVMAAPITSSEVFPAGISCAITCSSGLSAFHSSTIASPQAISSGLFESHTLMGPSAVAASSDPPEPPPHAAVTPRASTLIVVAMAFVLIASPFVGAPWPFVDAPWRSALAVMWLPVVEPWPRGRSSYGPPAGRPEGGYPWRVRRRSAAAGGSLRPGPRREHRW